MALTNFKIVMGKTYLELMSKVSAEVDADSEWKMPSPAEKVGQIGYAQILQKGDLSHRISIATREQK